MDPNAPNLNLLWARLIVEELVRNGVDMFCLSSGSRCAPLTVAVAEASRARSVMHYDERGAAFHALGYARASDRPAALICTSGTAGANYLPAVVEAAMARTPMVVITADRPPELQDVGANQTIDQTKMFGDYSRWHCDLPCPDRAVGPQVVLTTIGQAVYRATRPPDGPVHVNCAFREPLAPADLGEDYADYVAAVSDWLERDTPYTRYARPERRLSQVEQRRMIEVTGQAERGLLIVGHLRARADSDAVRALAHGLGWPTFPDVMSGLLLIHILQKGGK